MRTRLSGTPAERQTFVTALLAATSPGVVETVSEFYPHRDGRGGRVYLDLALPTGVQAADTHQAESHQSETQRAGRPGRARIVGRRAAR